MPAAAKLLIDIAADIAKLRSDFTEANNVIAGFGKGVEKVGRIARTALGGLGVGLSIGGLKQLVDSVADIGEQAQKVQLSTDSFQALQAAMRDAGVAGDTSLNLIAKASQKMGEAFDGNKEAVELMRRLGVGLIDARGNAAEFEQALPRVARAILAIENPMQRASAAAAFFGGKVGKEAIPALEEMAKGTEALKAQYASEIVPAETIRRFDLLSDSLKSLSKQATVEVADFLNRMFNPQVVAALKEVADDFARLAQSANDFAKSLPGGSDPVKVIESTRKEVDMLGSVIGALKPLWDAARGALEDYGRSQGQLPPLLLGMPQGPGGIAPPTEPAPGSVAIPGVVPPNAFTGFPAIKTTGIDKAAEAMRRLDDEIKATFDAIKVFESGTGEPTKQLERMAKLAADIGVKQSQMTKGVADPADVNLIKEKVEVLEQMKFSLEQLKVIQNEADEINKKFGDGQRELTDRLYYIQKAYDAGRITIEEYNAATKEATEAAERQALVHKGLQEGLEGVAAGFQYAALQMQQSSTDFQLGQDIFQSTFQLLSQTITEFADKGTIDFGRLAKAFGAMVLEMTLKWAAASLLRSLFGGAGGGGSSSLGSLFYGSPASALPSLSFGGPRAAGGPVMAGVSYPVGERGPEHFIPAVNGTIVPNGGGGIVVNIANYGQNKVSARENRGPNGVRQLDLIIEPLEARMADRMSRGQGALAGTMRSTYGLTPTAR